MHRSSLTQRCCLVFATLAAVSFLSSSSPARAQMGMDLFKKPAIAKAFHPVIGKGAEYQSTGKDSSSGPSTIEMGVISKESIDGSDGFWLQFYRTDSAGKNVVGKVLISASDFQVHRTIFQPTGKPAMEMDINPAVMARHSATDELNNWHSVGTETITVPAGTFSCDHWRDDKNNSDVWTSDKVTPYGLVKEVRPNSTMVLTKIVDHIPDRITGPVQKMDMQQLMQQMQQQRQQRQQNP
jgi:hypothetical protein